MLFCAAWDISYDEPSWFDDPAIGRLTVTSPGEERALRALNAKKHRYRDRVRPWNFAMVAYPTALERKAGSVSGTLVAPYESSPADGSRRCG